VKISNHRLDILCLNIHIRHKSPWENSKP
jgi:hypothetical protein